MFGRLDSNGQIILFSKEEFENSIPVPDDLVDEIDASYFCIDGEFLKVPREKSYQEKRVAEYPKIDEFLDAYYWQQNGDDTKMKEYVKKVSDVKAKYPKK